MEANPVQYVFPKYEDTLSKNKAQSARNIVLNLLHRTMQIMNRCKRSSNYAR